MQPLSFPTVQDFLTHSCDDIISGGEAVPIDDIDYDPVTLSDTMYKMLVDKEFRRKTLKNNKFRGLYANIDKVLHHVTTIESNEDVNITVSLLFPPDVRHDITPIDLLFLNCNYIKLIRAKIETEYLNIPVVNGSIITGYQNTETDYALAQCMSLFRIVCRFLGMKSTVDSVTFSIDKLKNIRFWASVSNKFLTVFGEEIVTPIEDVELPVKPALETMVMENEVEQMCIVKSLMFLSTVFGRWSGTSFTRKNDNVRVEPAIYVTKLLPKMRRLTRI